MNQPIAWQPQKPGCQGCEVRADVVDRVIPGLGTGLTKLFRRTGVKWVADKIADWRNSGVKQIGVFMPGIFQGGAERWLESIARESKNVWSACNTGPVDCADWSVPTVHAGEPQFQQWRDAQDLILVWGHSYGDLHKLMGGYMGDVKFVVHGCLDWNKQRSRSWHKRVSEFVAVSEACRVVEPDARVIRNGVDAKRVENGRRIELKSPVIMQCGRWSAEKNTTALAEVAAAWPECTPLACVPKSHAQNAIQSLGKRAVILPDNARDGYASADVLLVASPSEGCALVILEAWAAGVPVVATDVGVIPELKRDGWDLSVPIPVGADGKTIRAACEHAISVRDDLIANGLAYTKSYNSRHMAEAWDTLVS